MTPPKSPAGDLVYDPNPSPAARGEWIAELERRPADLRTAVAGLSDAQLDTKYVNWTIRQIVHHLCDSHVNAYIRFRWALTEDGPTIKAYKEGPWAELPDAKGAPVELSLRILEAVHARWAALLRAMSDADFARTFTNPESGKTFTLGGSLGVYAWHGKHHTAAVRWVRETNGW